MTINWLLIVVAIILIWNMVSGYRKGLVRILYRFVSSILAIILSLTLVTVLGDTMRDSLPFYAAIESMVESSVTSVETGYAILDLVLSKDLLGGEIAQQVSIAIFNVIMFVVIFLIVRIILSLIGRVLRGVSRVPVVGTVNRILGIVAGFAHGLIVVWMILLLCELAGGTQIGADAAQCISASAFLQVLSDNNIIWSAITALLI